MVSDKIGKILFLLALFLIFYFIPINNERVKNSVFESLYMLQDYARNHILMCLVPAFLIAGGIAVFVSKEAVIKYFGPKANKFLSYSVASVSGGILSVCSCTILPLFGGIYQRGAGLGPAITFLYSGPAINVLAIILTARILGFKLGIARAIGAILMGILIGLIMHYVYLKEEGEKKEKDEQFFLEEGRKGDSLLKNGIFFLSLVGILVFLNLGQPLDVLILTNDGVTYKGTIIGQDEKCYILKTQESPNLSLEKKIISRLEYEKNLYSFVYELRYYISLLFFVMLATILIFWFKKDEIKEWLTSTLDLSLQLLPLLFIGVAVAGFALGRPGKEALVPSYWVSSLVGGNSIFSNLFASMFGALMYFATLTEVPILQGLLGSGMGEGPALSLLLAGPAVSLPSILVLRKIMGMKKMLIYLFLVVIFSSLFGYIYGIWVG